MIVDVHYHLIPKVTEGLARRFAEHVIRAARIIGKDISPESIVKEALATWGDPTGERLISLMEESGIDATVICMVDDATLPQLTPDRIQQANRLLGEVARRYPGRVIPLAGIDPRRPQAPDMLRRCFEEFGVKGLKYHPDYGYNPCSPESYRLLEVLAAYKGVLLTHTGPLMPPSRPRYADPRLLADIGVDFPELKVIAAHMGGVEWRAWANLAAHQPNLYGDLAMWDVLAFGNYRLFCRELRDIIDYVGADKVLFGTDNPLFNTVMPTKDWVRLIKQLAKEAPEGIRFTEEEVRGILGGNAAFIFGLG